MILAGSIEFFTNLAQYTYDNQYYDFHNDYNFKRISFVNGILSLYFQKITDGVLLSLKFTEVEITKEIFFNVSKIDNLTIDNIYRGRIEKQGVLIEISQENKAYFYLEFYEGQALEFWAISVGVEEL